MDPYRLYPAYNFFRGTLPHSKKMLQVALKFGMQQRRAGRGYLSYGFHDTTVHFGRRILSNKLWLLKKGVNG